MDERSSECKRTDRACDMLEKGGSFLGWRCPGVSNGSNESKSGNEAGVSAKRYSGFRVWYVWIVAQNRA